MTMEPRVVATGLEFPEGPVVLPDGSLVVVEIRAGRLTRIAPDGQTSVLAVTGGGPNGAALGPDGALYVANNGGFEWTERVSASTGRRMLLPGDRPKDYRGGSIQRVTLAGEVTTLYTACDGEPLKGPNDLVFDAEGNFYFTDHGKTYGRQRDRTGVFYASPDGHFIREIIWPMEAPNGIGLSPDGRTLYVAESPTGRLWAFELTAPGQVGRRRVVGTVPGAPPLNVAYCDSLCVDAEGNVLVATIVNGGITVFSPERGVLRHVPCPDPFTTNACFGGPDLRTLYVTLSTRGEVVAFDNWPERGLKLFQPA
jgi:gluconolactonase